MTHRCWTLHTHWVQALYLLEAHMRVFYQIFRLVKSFIIAAPVGSSKNQQFSRPHLSVIGGLSAKQRCRGLLKLICIQVCVSFSSGKLSWFIRSIDLLPADLLINVNEEEDLIRGGACTLNACVRLFVHVCVRVCEWVSERARMVTNLSECVFSWWGVLLWLRGGVLPDEGEILNQTKWSSIKWRKVKRSAQRVPPPGDSSNCPRQPKYSAVTSLNRLKTRTGPVMGVPLKMMEIGSHYGNWG